MRRGAKTMKNSNAKSIKGLLKNEFVAKYGVLIFIILVMMVGTTIVEPVFLNPANLLNLLVNNNNVFLTAFGMTFVIMAGVIDLAVGSLAAISGMFVAMLLASGVGAIWAFLITLVVCYGLGMLNGLIITKSKIAPFVMTLGTMTIYRGLAIAINDGYTIPISIEDPFTFLGSGSILGIPVPICIIIIVFLIGAFLLTRTNIGRNVYAVGGNMEAARISGVNILSTNMFVYGMCTLLAGLSGMILAARMYTGLPSASSGLETQAIAAVVLGGTSFTGGDGDIFGTVLGVLLLAIMLNCMVLLGVPAWLQSVFQGVIIIVAVIFDQIRKSK